MVSLLASRSFDSLRSAGSSRFSRRSSLHAPHSPEGSVVSSTASNLGSASSSNVSLNMDDEENLTITVGRPAQKGKGKQKSQEDLRLLAISTHITELSYSISDIQTRIFEIQELRHQSQSSSSGDAAGASAVIDQSLSSLDERLEAVSQGLKAVNDSVEPLLQDGRTPTQSEIDKEKVGREESAALLRKHAALLADWEAVQKDSDMLRQELREDKWLTVFRTVTEQADGMMASLEKAVNRCQDFIRHFRDGPDGISRASSSSSTRSEKSPLSLDVLTSLSDTFERKKKHYMPATSKVLAVLDKGVQDRVTKNGECLRRHAESTQRWNALRERIMETEQEMEVVRQILLTGDHEPSEAGSSASGNTSVSMKNGYLATPPSNSSRNRTSSSATAIQRSISPFRKLARKLRGNNQAPEPATPAMLRKPSREPPSEPVPTLRRQRTSIFGLRSSQPTTPITPDRPGHKYSHSMNPEPSPSVLAPETPVTGILKSRPTWNSSTKVEPEDRTGTIKGTPPRRPSAMGFYSTTSSTGGTPSVNGTPYKRSLSRSSMASSRPWSPVTSSVSTAASSVPPVPHYRSPSRSTQGPPPMPNFRPSSRSGHGRAPSRSSQQLPAPPLTPRSRPRTPSHIPAPTSHSRKISGQQQPDMDDYQYLASLMHNRPSSAFSHRPETPSRGDPTPRPPSRSMIPVPSFQLSTASRPGSAMSQYRPESSMSMRSSALGPSAAKLRTRASMDSPGARPAPLRPNLGVLPPSSFRDGPRTPASRPGSRTGGAYTPGASPAGEHFPAAGTGPLHPYAVGNAKDPLDVEVGAVANSVPHGLMIERVDPPLRAAPKANEEVRAVYAFSSPLGRKAVTCKLTTMARPGVQEVSRKVLCRVGGGWQDLRTFLVTRQA